MHLRGKPVTLYAPTELKNSYSLYETNPTSPDKSLKLEWVYGYRGKDARSNLYLLPTGELVYFMASVVVLFNPDLNKQRHYMGHTEEVKWWVKLSNFEALLLCCNYFCASSLKLKGDYHRKTYNNIMKGRFNLFSCSCISCHTFVWLLHKSNQKLGLAEL